VRPPARARPARPPRRQPRWRAPAGRPRAGSAACAGWPRRRPPGRRAAAPPPAAARAAPAPPRSTAAPAVQAAFSMHDAPAHAQPCIPHCRTGLAHILGPAWPLAAAPARPPCRAARWRLRARRAAAGTRARERRRTAVGRRTWMAAPCATHSACTQRSRNSRCALLASSAASAAATGASAVAGRPRATASTCAAPAPA